MRINKHTQLFVLLLVLYIGLGLPDSLLSTTWPDISTDISVPVGYISLFSIIAIFCSMVSSSLSYKLNKLLGPVNVILLSMVMCLSGIIICVVSKSFTSLLVVQVIMGLGAGAIDANVNFIASQNLKVGEMNLLHGFWGVGVTVTPLITTITYALGFKEWAVFIVIAVIFILLILYSYLFKHLLDIKITQEVEKTNDIQIQRREYLGIIIYFMYGVEFLIGTFLASYLVSVIGATNAEAAFAVSCYWGGLMVSRLIMPLIFRYIDSYKVILTHSIILFLCIPLILSTNYYLLLILFVVIGYCFGPIFPTFVHYTELVNPTKTSFLISRQISSMYLSIFLSQVIVGYIAIDNSLVFFTKLVATMILLLVLSIISYLYVFKSQIITK